MEEFLARKRISIYLVLVCWGFSVAMMHPGFAMMLTGTLLLFLLFILRFIAHFEGQFMMKAAEADAAGNRDHASRSVFRRLATELGIAVALFTVATALLVAVVRHIPWLWYSTS